MLLGLDFGDTTIGVALGALDGRVAVGLTTLRRPKPAQLRESLGQIKQIVRERGISTIVLGMPTMPTGAPCARTEPTLAFKARLQRYIKRIRIVLWDERFSTKAVRRTTNSAHKIDEMAAVYILQGYLDAEAAKGDM